ncbi:LOW QUALITY PROTEIN: hypothetical protein PHMEG_00013258 [Phytophthora megakarya]|uniref:Tc1-like transposase DDE domain-containing protein n=1 Tax=Phytophthora megakarya TaxID=4795 RepID=A0A225W747_9STRA|nr:LOW QUALITY PROTEIN: hypothetical protein PHMEG_00013258 [Phytophthora megakarya]
MHIKELDVFRFVDELVHINWCYSNLVFLDEVSFDNRRMIRKRGYSLQGQTIAIRVTGGIDTYNTLEMFDRVECFNAVEILPIRWQALSYSGSNSVWFLDGSSIHRDPGIIHSIDVVPVFHPAYYSFFKRIEYMFGYIKKCFRRHYVVSSGRDGLPFVVETSIVLIDSLCQRYLTIAVERFKGISTRPGQYQRSRDSHEEQRAAHETLKKWFQI